MTQHSHAHDDAHGKASLGPLLCWAVVFADIGSSIYYVPGILYSNVGGLAGFFVLLTMIIFVLLTLKYAEVSSRFPEGGGVVSVAAQGIHTWVGALGGMFILVSYFLTSAISCLSAIQYLSVVFPSLLPYALFITIGVLVLLGVLNWIGISESAKVSLIAAFVAFGGDLVVLFIVFTHISFQDAWQLFMSAFQQKGITTTSLLVGFAGAFLAFSGLESISQLSPVMKAPRKKVISIALLLVVLTIGITSPLLTTLSTLLQPEAAGNEVLSTQLISLLGGRWGSTVVQQGVAISASLILIFAGNTAIIGAYHVFLALSRMDFLPTIILQRNRLRNTPHFSIALAAGIPILVLLIANGQINMLGDMYAFGLLGAFSITCLGLDIIRFREWRAARQHPEFARKHKLLKLAAALKISPQEAEAKLAAEVAKTPAILRQVRIFLSHWWKRLDFVLGVMTTVLVLLAWAIGLFSKPLGTLFGGAVVLLGGGIAVINYMRQGSTLVLPTPLIARAPGSVIAVLGNEAHNQQVIESALRKASPAQPVVFLYLSNQTLKRSPRPFEIFDPYLEDPKAKEAFSQAEKSARREGVPRQFVYQAATPEKLAHIWRFIRPLEIVLPESLMDEAKEINPDRLRYELTPGGKVAHLIKRW